MKKILNILIQIFFVSGFLYAGHQIFTISCGVHGILFNQVNSISYECLIARRLYAIEFWVIVLCYFVYLSNKEKILGK